ncbi:WhiB family transcriptional regulator [Nocardiopsis sp. LOL_012]|uniref:WhiB family transcriptional regulator n=1 Tax=Nocardiopsis sp. LOL_012 TaxID=3345409 RepID=UPI003A862E3B
MDFHWSEWAACQGSDLNVFFSNGRHIQDRARAVCGRCPVRAACLADAIEQGDQFGIRGGLNPQERRRVAFRAARTEAAPAA